MHRITCQYMYVLTVTSIDTDWHVLVYTNTYHVLARLRQINLKACLSSDKSELQKSLIRSWAHWHG